jgi:hypothetical protein
MDKFKGSSIVFRGGICRGSRICDGKSINEIPEFLRTAVSAGSV